MLEEQGSHPSDDQLAAFDGGMLSPDERAAIERHVASCTLCCQRLDALPDDPLVGLLRGSAAGSRGPSPTLSTGTRQTPAPALSAIPETPPELVNHPRYRIVGVLGGGGMGTVFKAEHRLMERIVA